MPRMTFWLDRLFQLTLTTGAQSFVNLTTSLSTADRRGITLVRLIYDFVFDPTDIVDSTTIQGLHMGVGLIESDAVTAGTLPDADIEGDSPGRGWVVREFATTDVVAGTSGGFHIGRMKNDIRAMRRIHQSEELLMIFDSEAISGTAQTIEINGMVRQLYKVP